MTRSKAGNSGRGRPIQLPGWWLKALNERCGERSKPKITEELNAASKRQPPFRVESVYDFLSGKVTTDVMMAAFLALFPDLPPPMFFAESYEEAIRFQQLSRLYSTPPSMQTPRVEETIEDTGEQQRPSERTRSVEKTRSGASSRRRAK